MAIRMKDLTIKRIEKGDLIHLDIIYPVQGLLPEGTWVNATEYREIYGEEKLLEVLDGHINHEDDLAIFLKDVELAYAIKVKESPSHD